MLNDAKILPHVISIWKSHPKQRPNEVWSLDALLQDQAVIWVNQVQATVRNQDIKKFQPILQGFLYFNLYARFKVIVRVIYDTGSASLLLCDDLVFKLSDKQCVHLIRQHGENYDDYFPDELNVLVGKRLLFRFHYTDDHINNTNHVYQVKMLSQDEAMITMFKKDFIKEDPEVDLQNSEPSNANSSSHGDGEHSSMSIESDAGGSRPGKRIFIDLDDYDEDEAQAKRMKRMVQVKIEPKDCSTDCMCLY
ncbi:hypothetical protein Tco_1227481 [Tanacetum coccineum]